MAKAIRAKAVDLVFEASGGDYGVPLDVVPLGGRVLGNGESFTITWTGEGTAPTGVRYWLTAGQSLTVNGRYWTAPFACAAVVVAGREILYSKDGAGWLRARTEEYPAPPNPFIQAPTPKLLAELEAKKRVPAKVPLQLILDDPDGQVVLDDPTAQFGWADEIAHEIAEAEKAWDEAYRDAHGEHLQRHPELMVAACEEMLTSDDYGGSLKLLGERHLPGFQNKEQWMHGLIQFFALDCIVPVDAREMRQELMQKSLTSLLRLAKAVNWGQPIESKDWTG